MRANVSVETLQMVARDAGVLVSIGNRSGRFTNFRLRLDPARTDENGNRLYGRISPDRVNRDGEPCKIGAVCYHGFYRFLDLLFTFEPDAIVVSGMARYDGRAQFKRDAPEVMYNAGPLTLPGAIRRDGAVYVDMCECSETVRDENGGC